MDRAGCSSWNGLEKIRIIKNGGLLPTPFLNVQTLVTSAGGEEGCWHWLSTQIMSAMACSNIMYTESDGSLNLWRYKRSANNPDRANPNSGLLLLNIPIRQIRTTTAGHWHSVPMDICIGRRAMAGGGGDQPNNAQTLTVLLGKILRIDVDHTDPGLNYSIPTSNPFHNDAT